jgi:hypothetical protein
LQARLGWWGNILTNNRDQEIVIRSEPHGTIENEPIQSH